MKKLFPLYTILLLINWTNVLLVTVVFFSIAEARVMINLPSDSLDIVYQDVSASNLPLGSLGGNDMDAKATDIDGDGDIDIILACEFCPNIILINDSAGHFTDESLQRLPQVVHDSEDIGVADFDQDGDLDIIFVSEDDFTNEFYINDGNGFFSDSTNRIPVTGKSNAVLAIDINADSVMDIVIGNQGQNVILINDGNGFFTDESSTRLPANTNTTQDLEWGDIDNDGDDDLLEGNENGNRILINDGNGFFTDETASRLPLIGEETREVDLGDVDGDGDLDIFYANVDFMNLNSSFNRLLLNDGTGHFTDVSATNIPQELEHTVDGDFVDVDLDGDLDILTAQAFGSNYEVLLNDGNGVFTDGTNKVYDPLPTGNGIDVEASDYTGDGLIDIYLTGFQRTDYLYEAVSNITSVEEIGSNDLHDFNLEQNYPNPFNPTTIINYQIAELSNVTVKVYDVLGNEVATLVSGEKPAGSYEVVFNGGKLSSGIYYYKIQLNNFTETKKMVLIR